jgi:ABC-type Fe3+/spermidine/putrescine transport system ATPase subunit
LKSKGLSKGRVEQKARAMIEGVGLAGFERRQVQSLSGGEQQRVALARAMAPEPRVLLFDEPLSSIDASLRKELRREIRGFMKRSGLTAIYVTHDQEEALAIADRIVLMNAGRVERSGSPWEVYDDPGTRFAAEFIGEGNCLPVLAFESTEPGSRGPVVLTELGSFIAGRSPQSIVAPNGSGTAGRGKYSLFFRREDVVAENPLSPKRGVNGFDAKLVGTEYLGRTYLCFFRAGSQTLSAEIPFVSPPEPGGSFWLSVPPEKCGIVAG